MKHYIVTGGTGFIGSNIAKRLVQVDNQVVVLDNAASNWLIEVPRRTAGITGQDFEVVTAIYEHFYPSKPYFSLTQAVEFARTSGLARINKGVQRRWKAFRMDND